MLIRVKLPLIHIVFIATNLFLLPFSLSDLGNYYIADRDKKCRIIKFVLSFILRLKID